MVFSAQVHVVSREDALERLREYLPATAWVDNDDVDDPMVEDVELQLLPYMLTVDAIVEDDLLPEETVADFIRDLVDGTGWDVEWVQLPEAIWGPDRRTLVDGEYAAWIFAGYHGEVHGERPDDEAAEVMVTVADGALMLDADSVLSQLAEPWGLT